MINLSEYEQMQYRHKPSKFPAPKPIAEVIATTQQVLSAFDALFAARKPNWVLGLPTEGDLKGLIRDAAARAKVDTAEAEAIIWAHRKKPRTARGFE